MLPLVRIHSDAARRLLHDMVSDLDVEGLAFMCSELTDYEGNRVVVCDGHIESAAHHAGRCPMCYQPEEDAND